MTEPVFGPEAREFPADLLEEVAAANRAITSAPAPVGPTLAEFLARAPAFQSCGKCGQATVGALCFDCQRGVDLARDAGIKTSDSIPEHFRVCRFGGAKLLECVRGRADLLARAEANCGATRVLLLGHSGMGKTSLVVAMMRRWSELNGKPAVFRLATDLATAKSRAKFGQESDEISEARQAPLLVIDDLGTDEFKPPSSPVTDVVFHRHQHMRPTWITSWMGTGVEAAQAVDIAAADRMMGEKYGAGFVRRVFEGARIIDCSQGLR